MNATLAALVIIAAIMTLGVLFTGLFTMARGGEFNAKYGNRLMQARVVVQAVALVLFVVAMLIAKG
ncbi:twin transmembrane helix small protein [Rhodovibrionaceae bacterium A322]